MVCVRVVFVEKFFAHRYGGLNAWFVAVIASGCGKVLVNMIHCQNCQVCAEVPWEWVQKRGKAGQKGYLEAFLGAGYVQDRGLGFNPEAAPSWDANALFRIDKAAKAQPGCIETGLKENAGTEENT